MSLTAAVAAGAPVQAGTLPIRLSKGATSHAPTPARAHVTVASQRAASALGVHGVVFSIQPSGGSGVGAGTGALHATLDYTAFRDSFGGDWASRLHLVELPACALTTPDRPDCRRQTPIRSTNDAKTGTLSADLTARAAAPATVLAASSSSDAGGGGGDFTATSLKASGSWQAGGSGDGFGWSYPIGVPFVPGGLQPSVGLSYSSQAVDGLTSSTNDQPSWIGDGWDYSPGYVERSYQSCHQNPAGSTQTYDECWSDDATLTLSLGGTTTTLIKDDTTGAYRPQDDASEKVQFVGATDGAQDGQYFVVTTTDGTRYFFGRNQLPGFGTGDAPTNSVWTVPVYATAPNQPCYNATFSKSWCQQAYRWNLDYVVDTHSDAVSYFYNTESNYYAADLGTNASAGYVRGGYLTKIQYGQRDGQVYSTSPAAQVLFTSTGRCDQSSCDPSGLTTSTAKDWPDTPYDLNCASGAACAAQSPSFWSEYALQSIQTQALVGSTETNVDSWSLAHSFPATGDSDTPALWLASITHTGQDTSAGGSSAPITLPPITFTGTPLVNRVNLRAGYPAITRQRLTEITTETGETIKVGYSAPACGTGTPSDPSQNTSLCYPDYWTPTGQASPILDWFNKFIVAQVTEQDPTGGSNDTINTTYTPVGTPAWHYDDNPLTPSDHRTWDQWRGYQGMIVTKGTAPDPTGKTQYTYFRGMDGDTLPNNGTRSATVRDSRGDPAITDSSQYAGTAYETVVYNGSAVVTDTVTDPWSSAPTATHAQSGLPAEQAFLEGTADTKVYTPLANGSTRETETDYTHDGYGRVTQVNDQGDVSTTADDLCTTTTFADNADAWILDKQSEVKAVSVNCSTTPSLPADAVSDTLAFYDGSATLGAAPTVGDVTMNQQATSYTRGTANYATMSTATPDQYGRLTATTDADGRKTSTVYTPAAGAEPTTVAVTDPMSHTATNSYDPLRHLSVSVKNAAGFVTGEQYDALGELTEVDKPGVGAALKFSYVSSNIGPSVVDTYTLNYDGGFRLSETLYDAMLRARETQTQTPDGGRTVTDTVYNSNGLVSQSTDPYYNSGAVSPVYVQAQPGQVPSATGAAYDGAGRKTATIAAAAGSATWQTTYTYGGNFTTTTPPAGGRVTTTITDARGRTTDLYTYHAGAAADPVNDPASAYDDTHYTYFPDNQPATVVDAAGNTWSSHYNLLGQQTSVSDPDVGTTTETYDNAGQLLTSTDARGAQTTTTYDADGRKTGQYDTTTTQSLSTANQIASWTYDKVKGCPAGNCTGYPTATTSTNGGDTSTQTTLDYNAQGQVGDIKTTLTGENSALIPAAGLVTSYGYSTTGYATGENDAAVAGLPPESVQTHYDAFGEPTSLAGTIPTTAGVPSWTYVSAVGYSEYGEPVLYTLPAAAGSVSIAESYDPQTQALTGIKTTDTNQDTVVDQTTYGYTAAGVSKGAGLVTSTTDQQNGGAGTGTQCFTYDYATRLSAAWTGTDNCSATPSSGNSATVGGPNPYWQSWTYDAAGSRKSEVDHDTTGNTAADTTVTYAYPTAGPAGDQPHTLSSTSATGPGATGGTGSYQYDASGNTTAITGGATGNQTLTWNHQDKLATDTTGAGTTSYVYGSAGNQIVRRDPGQVTVSLGDEQLVLNTKDNTVSGSRYYAIGGQTLAVRTSGNPNPQVLVPDRQGTDHLTIDTATYAATARQYLPFGAQRGTTPAAWPGNSGYIGGTPDASTQLENVGAREYDPAIGRFLSPDPVLNAQDPDQLGGYDYAGNDPTTGSDPTGLRVDEPCGGSTGVNCTNGGPEPGSADPGYPDSSSGYCDACDYQQYNPKALRGYGDAIAKALSKPLYLGGRKVPTFDELKGGRLGIVYDSDQYGQALHDWATTDCDVPAADQTFCGAAQKAGLLNVEHNPIADALIWGLLAVITDGGSLAVEGAAAVAAEAVGEETATAAAGSAFDASSLALDLEPFDSPTHIVDIGKGATWVGDLPRAVVQGGTVVGDVDNAVVAGGTITGNVRNLAVIGDGNVPNIVRGNVLNTVETPDLDTLVQAGVINGDVGFGEGVINTLVQTGDLNGSVGFDGEGIIDFAGHAADAETTNIAVVQRVNNIVQNGVRMWPR